MIYEITEEEKIKNEWYYMCEYMWREFDKEWPMFIWVGLKEFDYHYFTKNKKHLGPSEIKKDILLPFIKRHIKGNNLNISKLLNVEEVKKDISWLSEFAYSVALSWNMKFDVVIISLAKQHYFEQQNSLNFVESLKERYGFEDKSIELVSYFSEEINIDLYSNKLNKPIIDEFLMFEKKWQDTFNKEVQKAKKILECILERMFDQDEKLKKEVYSSR